jgi:hypothetical protein
VTRGLLILGIVVSARLALAQTPTLARAGEPHAIAAGTGARVENPLLIDKLKEALAKGVAPARLAVVLRELAEALAQAREEARPFIAREPPNGLLQALVEAAHAGVARADVVTVLRAGGRQRAVEVLTDLQQRGYPASVAARVVSDLCGRELELDQLVDQAERLRRIDGATSTEALDAIARASAQGLGLEHAGQLLHPCEPVDNNGRGPNRETSGPRGPKNGGVAAPGHATGH